MSSSQHISPRTVLLTSVTLVAFASNSILCRLALAPQLIDAASFTFIRLLSGTIALTFILISRDKHLPRLQFTWISAFALFAYAIPFSFAYLRIPAGVGALILFGAVQSTMIGSHLMDGNRLHVRELAGLLLALAGLAGLTLPGAGAPDLIGAGLMAIAGIAWGVYSLKGTCVADPLRATANNFTLSLVLAAPVAALSTGEQVITRDGVLLAVASSAIASGVGYAIWYTALRGLTATQAGIVQLLVPVLAAYGGVVFLEESISLRLVICGLLIFTGVVFAILKTARTV